MTTQIKITELANIGANISHSTLVPVVDMAGTPTTKKANLQITGNLILAGAGGASFVPAANAVLAQAVTNASQPNITAVGTLTSLSLSGNLSSGNNLNLSAVGEVFITSSPLRVASFTTAQRDALTANVGWIIFNTTSNVFQGYNGTTWVNF